MGKVEGELLKKHWCDLHVVLFCVLTPNKREVISYKSCKKKNQNKTNLKKNYPTRKQTRLVLTCFSLTWNKNLHEPSLKPKHSSLFITGQDLTCKRALPGKLPSFGMACLTPIFMTRCISARVPQWLWRCLLSAGLFSHQHPNTPWLLYHITSLPNKPGLIWLAFLVFILILFHKASWLNYEIR